MTNPYESPRPIGDDWRRVGKLRPPGAVWIVTGVVFSLCAVAIVVALIVMRMSEQVVPPWLAVIAVCIVVQFLQFRAVLHADRIASLLVGLIFVCAVPFSLAYFSDAMGGTAGNDIASCAMLVTLLLLPLGVVMLWWSERITSSRQLRSQREHEQ